MTQAQQQFKQREGVFKRAYDVVTVKDNIDLYKEWVESYDSDVCGKYGYVAPRLAVDLFGKFFNSEVEKSNAKVLDAGCGTGLVGEEFKKDGIFNNVDGMDLSEEMLVKAKEKNVYKDLKAVDMNQPLPYASGSYDGCICVGTFTHGHVSPMAIKELLRIVKTAGLVCFTVNEGIWIKDEFEKAISENESKGLCKVLDIKKENYLVETGVQSYVVSLRVL